MKQLTNYFAIILVIFILICSSSFARDGEEVKVDIVNDEFPEAQAEIQVTLDGIFKSIQDKDADKLISYHIYGPKFTEFRNDGPRFGSEGNEEYERGFVGAISAFDYNLGGLKIDVFGEVAIATFEADFRPTVESQIHQIWANVTLVFVKVNDTWKITHEHFSEFNKNKPE
jgi:ketosteroid isomerase-like protein